MNKCCLLRRDPFVNKGPEAVSKYLRDNFVKNVAQGYRA